MVVLVALSAAGIAWLDRSLTTVIPTVPAPDLIEIFFDRTPVTITFTIADQERSTAHSRSIVSRLVVSDRDAYGLSDQH